MVVAFAALFLPFAALDLFSFLNSQCGAAASTTTSSAQAALLDSAAEVLPPFAAVVVLFLAVTFTYVHLMDRHVGAAVPAAAGSVRRSISGQVLMFTLCVPAGTLQFILFAQVHAAGGGAEGYGAQLARALGLAALRALPAAATATFFPGMALIIVVHVRAGGEGGGTGAVDAEGLVQGLLHLLTKMAAGAAAALVGLMLVALTLSGAAKY